MKTHTLIGGQQIMGHNPEVCTGHTCALHNPSQHHMSSWSQNWRGDTGVLERICPHGVGHPDPDHIAFLLGRNAKKAQLDGIHGCDGCCNPHYV